jgi:hypothetical protein
MDPQTDHFAAAERWLAIAEREVLQRFSADQPAPEATDDQDGDE